MSKNIEILGNPQNQKLILENAKICKKVGNVV